MKVDIKLKILAKIEQNGFQEKYRQWWVFLINIYPLGYKLSMLYDLLE